MHRVTTLNGCHDEVGNLGLEWMLNLMHDHFFWPHMTVQARKHVDQCHPCLTFKAKQPRSLLEKQCSYPSFRTGPPDYLCLEPEKGKEENIPVVTDHFTQYAQAYIAQSQTALTTTKALWDNFIVHYGLPMKILSDQGRSFKSELIADLCRLMGTEKL